MTENLSLSRIEFVNLAIKEGKLKLHGNHGKAGSSIEKYLSVFREVFGKKDPKYFNEEVGYDWCCAYVYYLLKKVGYNINPTPISNCDWSLGAVRTWYRWAQERGCFLDKDSNPEPGDLILFDYLIEGVELDHIGIVVGNRPGYILSSEGNYFNYSGIFKRNKGCNIKGYIRL